MITKFKRQDVIYADELISLINNEDFKNFKYVRDMSDRIGIIVEISNFDLSLYEHTNSKVLEVFKDTVKYELGRRIVMLNSDFEENKANATEISKEIKSNEIRVLNAIPRIYKILNNPTKPEGLYFCNSLRKQVFNVFKEPEERKKLLEYKGIYTAQHFSGSNEDTFFSITDEELGIKRDKSFKGHFDFNKYKTWEILLKNLTNPSKNKSFYQTGSRAEVCPFEHFVKWLNIVLTKNVKTGILPIFVSATPGAGKGILQKYFFLPIFTDDYCTQINAKTLSTGFNAIIKNKLFWIFDEGQVAKAQQVTVAGTLKNLITEEKMLSENKGKDAESVENYSNGMIACNVFAIPLDTDDRRSFVLETHHKSLEERVVYEFGYNSINHFLKDLEKERDAFLKALVTFEFNHDEILARPIITEAKKKMIYATNTMTSNVISIIRRKDIEELKSFYAGELKGDDQVKLERICEEISNGFLTNESTGFLYDSLRNEKDKSMTKKLYWDKHFENSVIRKFKKLDGKVSSVQIRIIDAESFNKEAFELYMQLKTATPEELDKYNKENCDNIDNKTLSEILDLDF